MRTSKLPFLLLSLILLVSCAPASTSPGSNIKVITHPDGPLYSGDRVSFEVLSPGAGKGKDDTIEVKFNGQSLGSASIAPFGIGGRSEAALWWVWDTTGLKPGTYSLNFTRSSDQLSWTETYSIHPASQVPPPEPEAHWAESVTACCVIHYITGTAAARDIDTLGREADEQSSAVAAQMSHQLKNKIDVTLMSRVIGQGGFTAGGVYLSYLDGNYLGSEMPILFHHEFVHFYDAEIGGGYRPSIFEEGLAVYLTGGHFKPEPLLPRAAAMLDLGMYIPLATLANDFYNHQHEIGYLEGATLVKYLVDTYGWEAFNDFFRHMPAPDGRKDYEVIDEALRQHFNISFSDLESAYLAYVRAQTFTEAERTDLRLTVEFFDTVRRYQKDLDPSAYFLYAWLPDGSVMRQRGIVADFLRRPQKPDNRLLEGMFVRAWQDLSRGEYPAAGSLLTWDNRILDLVEAWPKAPAW
jgi:hypothetical protein